MIDKILKFQATWCGPCQALKMAMAGEDVGIPVEDIDIDKTPELAAKYRVRGVPTLIRVRGDQEVARKVGASSLQEVKDWVSETNSGLVRLTVN